MTALTVSASAVAARPAGSLRLRGQSEQLLRGNLARSKSAQISDGQALIDFRPQGQRDRCRGRRRSISCSRARTSRSCMARPPGSRRAKRRSRRRSHETFPRRFIQRPIATALLMVGLLAGGLAALPAFAGGGAAEVNYPTPYGHGAAAGHRPADHGILGGPRRSRSSLVRSRASPR